MLIRFTEEDIQKIRDAANHRFLSHRKSKEDPDVLAIDTRNPGVIKDQIGYAGELAVACALDIRSQIDKAGDPSSVWDARDLQGVDFTYKGMSLQVKTTTVMGGGILWHRGRKQITADAVILAKAIPEKRAVLVDGFVYRDEMDEIREEKNWRAPSWYISRDKLRKIEELISFSLWRTSRAARTP